jgi:hypothetical protein
MNSASLETGKDAPSPVDLTLSLLTGLAGRTLFQNEFVALILLGLKSGQELLLNRSPLLLLTVAHGHVLLRGKDRLAALNEGEQRRLEQDDHWEISALSESELLFLIPKAQ